METNNYVLVTAACNEERYIARTIESIIAQTVPPKEWVIVSDGSVDNTDGIVLAYSQQYRFIRLLRLGGNHPRNFAAQARAINTGWTSLQDTQFEFIGNLDADVTFKPTYFSDLMARFHDNPSLGLAGGRIREHGPSGRHVQTDLTSVPHTSQFFRRPCFEQIGGYRLLTYGGSDTCAGVMARMNGWEVTLFPDLEVMHQRPLATANGVLNGRFRQGRMDFFLGDMPRYEIARCIRRVTEPPLLIGSLLRLIGFFVGYVLQEEPMISQDYVRFSRHEQKLKLRRAVMGIRERRDRPTPAPHSGIQTKYLHAGKE